MIICVPPKSLTPVQKQVLQKNGAIVIETDNPESVRVINPELPVDTNDYFMSALQAIVENSSDIVAKCFVKNLYQRLKDKSVMPNDAEKV